MNSSLAITTFNIDRYTSLPGFLADYRAIGLNTLELNSRVPRQVIDALLPLVETGTIRIASLHNPCPRPDGSADLEPQLSSPDERTRAAAVRLTKITLDTAAELGAAAVVLHPGEVDGLRGLQDLLGELYKRGDAGSGAYTELQSSLIKQRRERKKRYLAACEKSLLELADYVERRGMRIELGLETPFYHSQFPSIEEYDLWFESLRGAPIHLWYDTGHWQVQSNLGLIERPALLDRHAGRLLGLHIHDCSGIDDHKVPGEGEIDFSYLRTYLRGDVRRVLEYGRYILPLSRIVEGITHLKSKGILE